MKILFVGDTPTVSSGFGMCTKAVCAEALRRGHDISVLGINEYGDPHDFPYKIFPARQPLKGGRDAFGVTRLPGLALELMPDCVVLLNDPWNVPHYIDALQSTFKAANKSAPPVFGWLAVDGMNQAPKCIDGLAAAIAWTEFGKAELSKTGYAGPIHIVPLGVDIETFYPVEQKGARMNACPPNLPENAYIVGVVGRNQIRKRLDLTIEYFAKWLAETPETDPRYLYLHVAPTGDTGCDIKALVRYYSKYSGISGRVILAEPHIGVGVSSDNMRYLYNSFDAYLTTSQAEGWCLPALEAMACGVPVVGPNFGGLGSWLAEYASEETGNPAILVHCDTFALTAPLNSLSHTIGGIPNRQSIISGLNFLYANREAGYQMGSAGISVAANLQWVDVGNKFCDTLESLM